MLQLVYCVLYFLKASCLTILCSEDVKIIRDLNGRSKGYGFVDLDRSDAGEMQAKFLLNQVRTGAICRVFHSLMVL